MEDLPIGKKGKSITWERFFKMYDMVQRSEVVNRYSMGTLGFVLPYSNHFT